MKSLTFTLAEIDDWTGHDGSSESFPFGCFSAYRSVLIRNYAAKAENWTFIHAVLVLMTRTFAVSTNQVRVHDGHSKVTYQLFIGFCLNLISNRPKTVQSFWWRFFSITCIPHENPSPIETAIKKADYFKTRSRGTSIHTIQKTIYCQNTTKPD